MTYIGELIGPLLSGFLTNKYGYPRAVTIMGCSVIFMILLYFPVVLENMKTDAPQRNKKTIDETDHDVATATATSIKA